MSLLRIRCSLAGSPERCEWVLVAEDQEAISGETLIADLPQHAQRVQLVIPAAQVLITRAKLPKGARRQSGSVLAYAVEDRTVAEPDSAQVNWLGVVGSASGEEDVLAVLDKVALAHWLDALEHAGIRAPEVQCETLLLPWTAGEWSLAWDGLEGFVRTGAFEGAVTDCGDHRSPPMTLKLMIEESEARGERPSAIALYGSPREDPKRASTPDIGAWQNELGVAIRVMQQWDWRSAPTHGGVGLAQQRRWRISPGIITRLRPAAWVLGATLAFHAIALVTDWALLSREQSRLRQSMETRFRSVFPDAVAVVDPALQMRRKLAGARHAAGLPDSSDFIPMITLVASATKDLPGGSVRKVSFENGRLTIELLHSDEAQLRRLVARLGQSGLLVEAPPAAPAHPAGATVIMTIRAS